MTEPALELETTPLEPAEVQAVIEAILLIADSPLDETAVAATLGLPTDQISQAIAALASEYAARQAGIEIRKVAGGWRLYTHPTTASWVERYIQDGQVARLTHASLETLAVVAYRQPVSRARISAIRGVNVDGVVKTLESRGLIEVESTDATTGALLYATTALFLEKIGLASAADLPLIAEFLPDLPTALAMEESL